MELCRRHANEPTESCVWCWKERAENAEEDYRVAAKDAAQLRLALAGERLRADHWYEKFASLETKRASCCDDNEQRAEKAEAKVKELEAEVQKLAVENHSLLSQIIQPDDPPQIW